MTTYLDFIAACFERTSFPFSEALTSKAFTNLQTHYVMNSIVPKTEACKIQQNKPFEDL